MNYSIWNCVDLHIHSKKSDDVKENDYDGKEYTADQLIQTLTKEGNEVNIFSITDHNCINVSLYQEVEKLISNNENYKKKINYVIGVELDINDERICEKVFHCLCFFDTKDVVLVEGAINKLFDNKELKSRNQKDAFPNIKKIFQVFSQEGIKNILLIPHFNNKTKGIKQDKALENLNYLCFNAYEDSNNVDNIIKSLDIYLKAGYDNFPFAVFSDNHNLMEYPFDKDRNKCAKCYMLSNIEHPFNSIKTSFEEPKLRISIENVDKMRNRNVGNKYINCFIINGGKIFLSPYQNTIIGKFGSGKSLLLEKIKKGTKKLRGHEKYSSLYDENENFKVEINGEQADSVDEAIASFTDVKKYEYMQQEEYYYNSKLNRKAAESLFNRININYNFLDNVFYNIDVTDVNSNYLKFKQNFMKNDIINNINYEKAFNVEKYYSVDTGKSTYSFQNVLDKLGIFISDIEKIKKIKIYDAIPLLNDDELKLMNDLTKRINGKISAINKIKSFDEENTINKLINKYNGNYFNNESKSKLSTYKSDIKELCTSFIELKKKCDYLEKLLTKEEYDEKMKIQHKKIFKDYYVVEKYETNDEYKSAINIIVKEKNRKEDLFKSVVCTIKNNSEFAQNMEFLHNLNKYKNYVNGLFLSDKSVYDIFCGSESMLKKSAGEKSSLFIKFLFDLIDSDLKAGNSVILILDQPEDNIDNENIYNEITNKIKDVKFSHSNFQSIIVTHNANIGIGADSENIIIAKEIYLTEKDKKTFDYKSGCIENTEYIEEVCQILEGGIKAMRDRTIKYGINIIKKV